MARERARQQSMCEGGRGLSATEASRKAARRARTRGRHGMWIRIEVVRRGCSRDGQTDAAALGEG